MFGADVAFLVAFLVFMVIYAVVSVAGLVLAILNITKHQEAVDIVMLVLTLVVPFIGAIAAIVWYFNRRKEDATLLA